MGDYDRVLRQLQELIGDPRDYQPAELTAAISDALERVPDVLVTTLLSQMGEDAAALPASPLAQAIQLDSKYAIRPHLEYINERIVQAVHDVENGRNRMLRVSIGPRTGKSTFLSQYLPTWILRKHPDWKIGMVSYGDGLAVSWGRAVRRIIESNPALGIRLAADLSKAAEWETEQGGGIVSRGINSGYVGLGFKLLLVDDPVKGAAEAHSKAYRDAIWERWVSDLYSRLEPPYLVIVLGTRYHEDDLIGRLSSDEYPGNPNDWEPIVIPALAEEGDVLGRLEGEPLISPLVDETRDEALARWADVKASVGSYYFDALYMQRPAPSTGAIFDIASFRYWTTNPENATDDGRIRYIVPGVDLVRARWLDSWDFAFKGADTSDYVVGQRWARLEANRYLVAQQRARMSFTRALAAMLQWAKIDDDALSPCGHLVHQRLVEEKANGAAIINSLREQISGLKPINPTDSKEARYRAVTPEVESGNVYLPYPGDPGNDWVQDYLNELRDVPHASHDDSADSTAQALLELRGELGKGRITVPTRAMAGRKTMASVITARRRSSSGQRLPNARIPGR